MCNEFHGNGKSLEYVREARMEAFEVKCMVGNPF